MKPDNHRAASKSLAPWVRVELGAEVSPGVWQWRASGSGAAASERSRQPLLDACRVLRRMGEAPAREIRAYWPGRQDWALRTTIGAGAALTVDESNCRFAKRKPRPRIEGAAKAGGAA